MIRPKFSSPQVTVKGQVNQMMGTSFKGQQVMSTSAKGQVNKVMTQVNQVPMTFPSFKSISTPKLQVNEVESQVTAMWNKMYPGEQRPTFDPTEFFQMFPGIKSDVAFYKSYYLYVKHKQVGERFLTVDAFIAFG
jgi:hypothetical protein